MHKLLFISLLLTIIRAEEMPFSAKAGQCFTKSFFPPKELKTVKTTLTKRVVLRKSTIRYDVKVLGSGDETKLFTQIFS